MSYEAAACLPVAYGTALRMMVTIGQVKAGEKVLILGASGGVGTCCVQLAKLAGAEVIVCASSATKLARLKELGADHGIDYTQGGFREVGLRPNTASRIGAPSPAASTSSSISPAATPGCRRSGHCTGRVGS